MRSQSNYFIKEEAFSSLVQRVQRDMVEAEKYMYLSLADVQEQSPLKHRLLDHIIAYQNYPAQASDPEEEAKKQAIAIALQDTPGKVIEADSDKNVYEIEIRSGNRDIEYKIDKYTGKIVDKDVDNDDDDDEWDND
ncbi:PepSY domain-containing protein [Bacillus paralicheniformis]|uniref:PepSY domain-containing protein n=1 Tax=Bacillus paralicheniformis TaxID=1648923 RepID=UPI0021A71C1F|nr:PepSY domain-containing protein [Bacillus paralicheniformis]UWS61865.1 PepSY domain-containing protein [Bacillus paralicheniformis]